MIIVEMKDARYLKYCVTGVRSFFNEHNLDFRSFVKNGIEESYLINTKDSMAIKLVERAKNRINEELAK